MEKSSKLRVIGLAMAGLGMAVSTQTIAAGPVTGIKGPVVSGLVQSDMVFFNKARPRDGFLDSARIQRADLGVSGDVNQFWNYGLSYRFSNNGLRNAWVGYKAYKPFSLQFGQYDTIHFGLENSSSSADRQFVGDSSLAKLWGGPTPVIGLRGMGSMDIYSYQLAAWVPGNAVTNSLTTAGNDVLSGRDPWGMSFRGTVAPVQGDYQTIHFGAGYLSQAMTEYSSTVTLQPIGARGTPNILSDSDNFKRYNVWNLEAAAIMGPFSGQVEYARAEYKTLANASNVKSRKHDAWYVQAGYVITGESRQYNNTLGTVGGIKPRSQFGAWELTARYDMANLRRLANTPAVGTVGDIAGGATVPNFIAGPGLWNNWTLGANYHASKDVKFALNYTDGKAQFVDPAVRKRLRFWAFRGQVKF